MAFKVACVLLALAMVCYGSPYYYGEDRDMAKNQDHGYRGQGSQSYGQGNQGPSFGSSGGQAGPSFGPGNQGQGFGGPGGHGSQGFGPGGNQGPGYQGGQGQGYGPGDQGNHRKGYQEFGY